MCVLGYSASPDDAGPAAVAAVAEGAGGAVFCSDGGEEEETLAEDGVEAVMDMGWRALAGVVEAFESDIFRWHCVRRHSTRRVEMENHANAAQRHQL